MGSEMGRPLVPATPSENIEVVVIGCYPRPSADGSPFSTRVTKVLKTCLLDAGIAENRVFCTHAVPAPLSMYPGEETCSKYTEHVYDASTLLLKELSSLPSLRVVVAMGPLATQAVSYLHIGPVRPPFLEGMVLIDAGSTSFFATSVESLISGYADESTVEDCEGDITTTFELVSKTLSCGVLRKRKRSDVEPTDSIKFLKLLDDTRVST